MSDHGRIYLRMTGPAAVMRLDRGREPAMNGRPMLPVEAMVMVTPATCMTAHQLAELLEMLNCQRPWRTCRADVTAELGGDAVLHAAVRTADGSETGRLHVAARKLPTADAPDDDTLNMRTVQTIGLLGMDLMGMIGGSDE